MKRDLPPLNALRVFEVAARCESFSQTAELLCVTQSAVSKQIRLLEEHLGLALFQRQSGAVRLTQAGKQYLSQIITAFDILETSSEKINTHREKETLRINLTPSLSTLWMFTRVKGFQQQYPHIRLNIESADDKVDWSQQLSDLAIRCLEKEKAPNDSQLLSQERLVLIAQPNLLKTHRIDSVDQLAQLPCIELKNRPLLWEEIFQKPSHTINRPLSCEHFYMVLQAVQEGLGIGLVPDFLCKERLHSQQIVNPLAYSYESHYGYYLLTAPHKKSKTSLIEFSQWLGHELNPSAAE